MRGQSLFGVVIARVVLLLFAGCVLAANAASDPFDPFGAETRPTVPAPGEVAKRLSGANVSVRRLGAHNLVEIGQHAIEILPAIKRALNDSDPEVRLQAALCLENLEQSDPAALPIFVEAFDSCTGDSVIGITIALIKYDPARTPAVVKRLIEMLASDDHRLRVGAIQALQRIGTPAESCVPALIELLKDENEEIRCNAIRARGRFKAEQAKPALLGQLRDPLPVVRGCAAAALFQFKPLGREIGQALLDSLKLSARVSPPDGVERGIDKIAEAVPDAVEQLTAMLSSERAGTREAAARVLASLKLAAKPAIPALLKALEDANPQVRAAAAYALGTVAAPGNEEVLAALLRTVHDKEADVRLRVVGALEQLAPDAPRVEEALIALLRDNAPHVQARAASVLGVRRLISLLKDERAENRRSIVSFLANPSIEVDDTEEFAVLLVPLLSDANADFRRLVVEALGHLAAQGQPPSVAQQGGLPQQPNRNWVVKQVVPAIAQHLKDKDATIRAASASALGQIGVEAKSAIGQLTEAVDDPEISVRGDAVFALERSKADAQRAVAALVRALRDESPKIRASAALALSEIGSKDDDARAALVEAFANSDNATRAEAVAALGSVGQAKDVVPTLLRALKDPRSQVRRAAVEALKERGAATASQSVPALSAALGDEAVDTFAADALIVIGEQSPLVVQQLVKILDQPESGSVPLAVRILQGIDAAPATTALIRLVCESENSDVTDEAVEILAQTGPSAKEAVSLIVDANVDANEWESRTGLAQILRDIGPAVVPELVAALGDPSAHRRLVATWALGDYGPGAKDAVPALLKATRDRDKKCREAAFIALGRVGGDVDGKLTALLQSLADAHGDGSSAIDKLILIGKPALPVLRQGLHDKNAAVRHGALRALGAFSLDAPEVVPEVIPLLQDPDDAVRWVSVSLLHRYARHSKVALPALHQLVRDEKKQNVRKAAEAAIAAIESQGQRGRRGFP